MADPKSKRTSSNCQQENVNLQLRAGGLQYLIAQNTKDLAILNDQMRDLATEFHKLKAQEDYEAKVQADAKAEAQKLTNEAKQATTQSGSEAAPTPSQPGPDEQSQKKE